MTFGGTEIDVAAVWSDFIFPRERRDSTHLAMETTTCSAYG